MAWPVRRVFRLLWWMLCTLTFLALPLMIWDMRRRAWTIKLQAWFIGGIFVIMSIPISVYEVAMHTEYYTRPRLQRHVIRILWMVAIYGVDAWLALRFRDAREYLDPLRECYEAFVIWSFFAYLMAYLEDEVGDVVTYLASKPPMTHFWPFKLVLRPWPMGHRFLIETKKGVMNYVIMRPLTTALALITDVYGKYGQGKVDLHKSYIYLAVAASFSQLWALYCLAQLYWACHSELAPIRPLSKFVCIKAVVFLTFWQGVTLAVLVSSGMIVDESWSTYDQLGVATGIQDFLVCIEMFIAALAHAYAFPPRDYMGDQPTKGFLYNVRHMFDLRDVVHDMGEVVESHVDDAAEAVTQTTHAVLKVPKKAVRTAAKGLKAAAHAPESLFHFFSTDHGKRGRRFSSSGDAGRGDHMDEERGLLLDMMASRASGAGEGGPVSSVPLSTAVSFQHPAVTAPAAAEVAFRGVAGSHPVSPTTPRDRDTEVEHSGQDLATSAQQDAQPVPTLVAPEPAPFMRLALPRPSGGWRAAWGLGGFASPPLQSPRARSTGTRSASGGHELRAVSSAGGLSDSPTSDGAPSRPSSSQSRHRPGSSSLASILGKAIVRDNRKPLLDDENGADAD